MPDRLEPSLMYGKHYTLSAFLSLGSKRDRTTVIAWRLSTAVPTLMRMGLASTTATTRMALTSCLLRVSFQTQSRDVVMKQLNVQLLPMELPCVNGNTGLAMMGLNAHFWDVTTLATPGSPMYIVWGKTFILTLYIGASRIVVVLMFLYFPAQHLFLVVLMKLPTQFAILEEIYYHLRVILMKDYHPRRYWTYFRVPSMRSGTSLWESHSPIVTMWKFLMAAAYLELYRR